MLLADLDTDPVRGTSLHDGVAARLRSLVFDGRLAPGSWIDEKALAEQWQVSRTPLREALKVLAAEGLVDLVPHRGCRVIQLGADDAEALFPVMALLEGRCAQEAAPRRPARPTCTGCNSCTTRWNTMPRRTTSTGTTASTTTSTAPCSAWPPTAGWTAPPATCAVSCV